MEKRIQIIVTDYKNRIAEMEEVLEFHINGHPFNKEEINRCLDEIDLNEKRLEKLSFYLKNSQDVGGV